MVTAVTSEAVAAKAAALLPFCPQRAAVSQLQNSREFRKRMDIAAVAR
jgi:hypothetical protein